MKKSNKDTNTIQTSKVAYQNKDIVSKIIGEGMIGKPLSIMGWDTELYVAGIKPTNLPAIKVNELRLDNLFLLNDKSIAIIDYESTDKKTNVIKYMDYVIRILSRYELDPNQKIRVMVLYTADIEQTETFFDIGCLQFTIHAAYLTGIDSAKWLSEIEYKIANQDLDYETMVHMIMLPLTYKGEQAKNQSIESCVHLATKIKDNEKQKFVLAGILSFSDKVINDSMRNYIERRISMTQVGNALMERGRLQGLQEGLQEGLKAAVFALKTTLPDFDSVFHTIRSTDTYGNVSKEEVQKYYDMK